MRLLFTSMSQQGAGQVPDEVILRKYLDSRKVLIVDPSLSTRAALSNLMQSLGAKSKSVLQSNSYAQATDIISVERPHVVITEYELEKRCGLDLLQSQRVQRPTETKDCIFIIVTGNASQSAVAKAAEEDVDAFIVKPYSSDHIRTTLIRSAVFKLNPPPYYAAISIGKKSLAEGKLNEAEEIFTRAIQLDKLPSLAYFYLGETSRVQKVAEEAKGKYQKGLHFNRIHYKCMVGLYDLHMLERNFEKAYEIVKRISTYFPANPKRLVEILRLAIQTGQYDDIEKYYAIFQNIDDRSEELIRHVTAALVVCGKHYLSIKPAAKRGVELFEKACVISQGKTGVLKEVILSLVTHGMIKDARKFLPRFPVQATNSPEYLFCEFLIECKEGHKKFALLDKGRSLLAKNIVDENIYIELIMISVESKLEKEAGELVLEACKHFPSKSQNFERLVRKKDSSVKK